MEDSRVLKVSQLRDGDADVVRAHAGKVGFNSHQFAGVGVGQRMQQGCVDDAVDGGGGSDAEGHGGDGNQGKSGRPVQHAKRVAEIEEKILSKRKTLLGVVLLANGLGRAKLQCGLPARLGGRHAGAQILLSLQGKMLGHLFLEALVGAPSGGEVRETNEKAAQESHGRSSALTSKKRAMIAAVWFQSRVSACSCLRPVAVRR